MRRNLFVVVLIPCILSLVLIALIIMDKRHDAKRAANKPAESTATSSTLSQTTIPTTTDAPITSETESQTTTAIPTTRQTTAQTQTAAPAPTTNQTSAATSESQQEQTSETTKSTETDQHETEPSVTDIEYDALYTQKGEAYTLIADRNSKHFIFINNQDNTARKTEFTYHQKYEQYPGEFYGPVLGYKNKLFVFLSQNNIVVSDGVSETIILTLDIKNKTDDIHIDILLESENRLLAGIDDTLFVIDCKSLLVEKYKVNYSDLFFVFTDESLCFSSRKQIPGGPYYTYIYSAQDGEVRLLGSIGEIDDYILDNDIVYIQSQDMLLQINLKTGELTSPYELGREQMLYFPVYGQCLIEGLSEIKYINYNDDQQPEQAITLPDFLEAECYYPSSYAMPIFILNFKDQGKAASLPKSGFGSFSVIDRMEYPLKDGKFILHSTVKEKLYSGNTCMGEGEIFLLERVETRNNDSILFEMIYAWIPVDESYAYQFYIYVPEGDTADVWLNFLKQLLQAE